MKKQGKLTKIVAMLLSMCILFGCVACAGPVDSPEPTDPTTSTTAPTDPASPTNPEKPTDPGSPTNPVNPTDPENPTDPSDPTDPENPTDPSDPSDPTDPENPTDPSDPSDPSDPGDPSDPSGPNDPTEPNDPIGPDVPAVNPETDPEKIFIKTIHDFDGYRVDNLDDQEDTNFVVYAQGVQELTATATSNVLQSVDEASLTYIFKNPDAAMKALKAGDVFFIQVSEYCPEGASVKVKSIKLSGDTATIQGEEVALEDLFTYIDVDMYISADAVYYDKSQLKDGMTVDLVQPRSAAMLTRAPESGDHDTLPFAIKLGCTVAIGMGTSGGLGASGNAGFAISVENVRVKVRYSFWEQYFEYSSACDVVYSVGASIECKGSWDNGDNGKIPVLTIPTNIPIFCIMVDAIDRIELSGSISGGIGVADSFTIGSSYDPVKGYQSYCNASDPTYSRTIEVEGTVEVSTGLRIGVGIPKVFSFYAEGTAGWGLKGTMTLAEEGDGQEESIHDCDACIDGDAYRFYRITVGLDEMLFSKITGVEPDISFSPFELEVKVLDFYCSYRADGGLDFDWTECPHKRWRTTFNAKGSNGEAIDDLDISVEWYNGSQGAVTDTVTTDASGKAVLYLPDGEWKAWYEENGNRKSADVNVSGKPVSQTVELDTNVNIYVFTTLEVKEDGQLVPETHPDKAFYTRMLNAIKAKYPNVIIMDSREYGSVKFEPGDVIMSLEWVVRFGINDGEFYSMRVSARVADAFEYDFTYGTWMSDKNAGIVIDTGTWQEYEGTNLYRFDSKTNTNELIYNYSTSSPGSIIGLPTVGGTFELERQKLSVDFQNEFSRKVEKTYQYIDLWLSGEWNEKVEQLIPQ